MAARVAEAGKYDAFTIAGIRGHSNVCVTARFAHATSVGRRRRRAVDALAAKPGHNLATPAERRACQTKPKLGG